MTHPHLEGLIRLGERIRMASVMACGGIPNAEAYNWSLELRELAQAIATPPRWEWDYGHLTHGPLEFSIWIAWDNGNVDYVEEGATVDFAGCVGWMHATPPEAPKEAK